MEFDKLSNRVIGSAIEVHKELGPGLLENTYKQCLVYECHRAGMQCLVEVELQVIYKGVKISCGYRMDMLLEDQLILELKCVDRMLPIHEAQLITYLKLSGKSTGLLINFNEKILKHGIKRFVDQIFFVNFVFFVVQGVLLPWRRYALKTWASRSAA